MAAAELTGGSQTATVGTEHTLYTAGGGTNPSDKGKSLQLVVDCVNMVAGDALELRVYSTPRASGTERLAYLAPYADAQDDSTNELTKLKISVPIAVIEQAKFTLKQTQGGSRAFVWAVDTVA